ncbi:MAG: hypothetical protein QOF37_196 [Thermoleophilaceae bacterium]|nr:hypothetical protein [Thermoleophilaceae bacterium]
MIIEKTLLTIAALAAGVAVAGCGSSSSSSSSSQSTAQKAPASAPKPGVKLVSPKAGAKTGSTITAKVSLTNFHIAPNAVGQAPRPGQGHLHFKMDEGKFDYPKYSGPNGLIAKKLGVTGHYSPALAPKITYKHLPKGKHVLEVYLANNNHTNVGVDDKVTFVVK